MPVPDPPFSTPRIMKVLEPSAGQYEVVVRMDPTLASKFPDKPFGTDISAIGLAKKDSDKYPGYTLVAIEPADKGGKDHLWIFQKLSGPEWTTTSNSRDNLTPAKYRGQTVVVKTEQEVAPATAPTALTGDLVSSVVTQTPNTGKAVLAEVTETIDENAAALEGEEYGDIVTKSVAENLVLDGTDADSGMDVISSVLDPIGNGKSVKQTKRVKGGIWPNPLGKEVSKGGSGQPPARYLKDLTRTKTTQKIAASAIPNNPTLSGDEVDKSYVKETPDRAEQTTTTETLSLTMSSVDQAVERKPFVTIISTMTPGAAPSIPGTGNGSSRLVYENGATTIYENTAEVATARPGPAGVETNAQAWGAIVTASSYSTNSTPPKGGSSNLVYNDGAVTIYEVSAQVVSVAGTSKDVEPREWGSITWNGAFNTATSGEKSTQVWSNGVTQVYKNETSELAIKAGSFVSKKEVNPLFTETVTSTFSTSPSISGAVGESSAVFSIADKVVYENKTVEVSSTTSRRYGTVVRFAIPATLRGITALVFPRKDGTSEVHYQANIEEGTEGYLPATVIETFEKNPSGPTKGVKSFKPAPVAFTTPFGSLNVGATLHGDLSFSVMVGTTDPIYEFTVQQVSIPATTPPSAAGFGDILVSYTSEPFKDGFITREVYVTL